MNYRTNNRPGIVVAGFLDIPVAFAASMYSAADTATTSHGFPHA
ncbi:hypothetical protein [Burkholderia cepacia]|nr:hypothetical protein [Burkholderia cepacia]